jgi:hypothetical protein
MGSRPSLQHARHEHSIVVASVYKRLGQAQACTTLRDDNTLSLLQISRHNDVWRQLEAWTGLVTQRRPNATHWVNEPVTVPANNFSVAVKS